MVQTMMNKNLIDRLNQCLDESYQGEIRIMEICGTHTQVISKSGLRHLLPKDILLLSGPGCPVCVTPEAYIDHAIKILESQDVVLMTFGDMMKVKGTCHSLAQKKADGSKIKVVYSPEETLSIADKYRDKPVVFAAVGFETTAPLIAVTVKQAIARGLDNLLFLTALKCMEPAIRFILQDERNKIHGMICPGHVASIRGAEHFGFITEEFGIPAAVCGFETADITAGICLLLEQLAGKRPVEFVNLYKRCVSPSGNKIAQHVMNEVFDVVDGAWRGIGSIKNSALVLKDKYGHLDAAKVFANELAQCSSTMSCICSDILLGLKSPGQCRYYGSVCTPEHPSGPCMVSSEGACAVHFRYGGNRRNG